MYKIRGAAMVAFAGLFAASLGYGLHVEASSAAMPRQSRFEVYFPDAVHKGPITGRVIIAIQRHGESKQAVGPIFGQDVSALQPGRLAIIDGQAAGFPLKSLADLPPGTYDVKAFLNVYTKFSRSDGHVIWAHMDQWEGQHYSTSPGNLDSSTQTLHVDAKHSFDLSLALTHVIAPVKIPADTMWVKHIKIKSALLSKFWGHPIYLGAVILLPKGYATHPNVSYPVIYEQGHFDLGAPFGFTTENSADTPAMRRLFKVFGMETNYEFYQAWNSAHFPRMIVVTFQHPTPYFDDSYAVNSANNGPYGDAIMTELIPYIEAHFRIIRQPYARVLTGASTGGWEALALQVYHPSFFGGTWVYCPDPIDFHHYDMVDIYHDSNAFFYQASRSDMWGSFGSWNGWLPLPPRYFMRDVDGQPLLTTAQFTQLEAAQGSKGRTEGQFAIWDAVYGPVGPDGYPVPLWDANGKIDRSVALYMRDHGYDLTYYTRTHWPQIGPQLVGKLHFIVGDMDNFYLNLAVYDMQAFLENTTNPYYAGSFEYGRPMKGHGWMSTTRAVLVRTMATYILQHAPGDAHSSWYDDDTEPVPAH